MSAPQKIGFAIVATSMLVICLYVAGRQFGIDPFMAKATNGREESQQSVETALSSQELKGRRPRLSADLTQISDPLLNNVEPQPKLAPPDNEQSSLDIEPDGAVGESRTRSEELSDDALEWKQRFELMRERYDLERQKNIHLQQEQGTRSPVTTMKPGDEIGGWREPSSTLDDQSSTNLGDTQSDSFGDQRLEGSAFGTTPFGSSRSHYEPSPPQDPILAPRASDQVAPQATVSGPQPSTYQPQMMSPPTQMMSPQVQVMSPQPQAVSPTTTMWSPTAYYTYRIPPRLRMNQTQCNGSPDGVMGPRNPGGLHFPRRP